MKTLIAIVLLLGCLFARAQEIQIPKLVAEGYMADPDGLLSTSERDKLKQVLQEIEEISGVKLIIAIQKSVPLKLYEETDFDPSKAAVELIKLYGKAWGEGTHNTRPGEESFIMLICAGERGWAFSGTPERERQIFTKENYPKIQEGRRDFYKVRGLIRREFPLEQRPSLPSPEFLGLRLLLTDIKPVFSSFKKH